MKTFRLALLIACLITGATAATIASTAGPTTDSTDSPTTATSAGVTTKAQTQVTNGTTETTDSPTTATTDGATKPGTTAQTQAPKTTRSGTTASSLTTGSTNVTTGGSVVSPTQTSKSEGLSAVEKVVFIVLGGLVGVAVLFCIVLGCCRKCKTGNQGKGYKEDGAGNGLTPNGHVQQSSRTSLQVHSQDTDNVPLNRFGNGHPVRSPSQDNPLPANGSPSTVFHPVRSPNHADSGHVQAAVDVYPTPPQHHLESPRTHDRRRTQNQLTYNYDPPGPTKPPRTKRDKRKQESGGVSEYMEPVEHQPIIPTVNTVEHGAEYSTTLPTSRTPGDASSDTERDRYKELPRPKKRPSSPHPRKKATVGKPPLHPRSRDEQQDRPDRGRDPRHPEGHRNGYDDRRDNDHREDRRDYATASGDRINRGNREHRKTDRRGQRGGGRAYEDNADHHRRRPGDRSPRGYERNPDFRPQHSTAHGRRGDPRDELQDRQDRNYKEQVRTLDRDLMKGNMGRRRSSSRSRQMYYSGTNSAPSENWSYGQPSVQSEDVNNRPRTNKGRRDKEKRISATLERGSQDGTGRLWQKGLSLGQLGSHN